MRLDMSLAVVGQAHEAGLDGPVASPHAEVAEGFSLHVGERSELGELAPRRLLVDVGQVAPQYRPRGEGGAALGAVVHTHVIELVPVDLDALQAVGVTTCYGDWVSQAFHAQQTVIVWRKRETRLGHDDYVG